MIALQLCAGLALALGSASLFVAVCAAFGVGIVVLLFPRAALLAALAAVPLADILVRGFPIGEALVAAAGVGLVVRLLAGDESLRLERPPFWLTLGFAVILYLLFASTISNGELDGDAVRRFGHLLVGALVAVLIAARAVEPASAAKALLAGLLFGALVGAGQLVFGFSLVEDPGYDGRLTGLFGDPNVAAFYVVTLGTASLGLLKSRHAGLAIGAALLVTLIATFSRTGLLAAALALVWVVAGHRNHPWVPVVALAVCAVLAFELPQHVQKTGPFKDRGSSDSFRRDVYDKSKKRAAASPVLGEGASPERLLVQGGRILPHNSYLAAVIEGGVVWLLAWVALLVTTLWKLTRARRRNLLLEAAFVALFIVAINLGEVLSEVPTMVLIGLALAYLALDRSPAAEVSPLVPQRAETAAPSPAHGVPAPP